MAIAPSPPNTGSASMAQFDDSQRYRRRRRHILRRHHDDAIPVDVDRNDNLCCAFPPLYIPDLKPSNQLAQAVVVALAFIESHAVRGLLLSIRIPLHRLLARTRVLGRNPM